MVDGARRSRISAVGLTFDAASELLDLPLTRVRSAPRCAMEGAVRVRARPSRPRQIPLDLSSTKWIEEEPSSKRSAECVPSADPSRDRAGGMAGCHGQDDSAPSSGGCVLWSRAAGNRVWARAR